MLQRYRRQTVREGMPLSTKQTSKLIREAKLSAVVAAVTTTPKAVILKMPNAIVAVNLAI